MEESNPSLSPWGKRNAVKGFLPVLKGSQSQKERKNDDISGERLLLLSKYIIGPPPHTTFPALDRAECVRI